MRILNIAKEIIFAAGRLLVVLVVFVLVIILQFLQVEQILILFKAEALLKHLLLIQLTQ